MGAEDTPTEVEVPCPGCSTEEEHHIIRRSPRGDGEDVLVRCQGCNHVHTILLRPPRPVTVTATLSDGNTSIPAEVEADDDEVISVDDLFEHGSKTWRITRIDDSQSRPRDSLTASRIRSMWAIRFDKVVVSITVTDGEISKPIKIDCDPDRVFSCGSIMILEDKKWRIRAIHTGKGRTLTGSRPAREVRRLYLHVPE